MTLSEQPVLSRQPRRLSPLSPVAGLVFAGRELVGVVVVAVSSGLWVLLPVGLAVVLALRFWSWWQFTFELEDGGSAGDEAGSGPVLRVDSGILQRQVRRIPLDRIQRVEVLRKVRHRVLGLAALRVDTAGGSSGGEVDLDALSLGEATTLRTQLDEGRRRPPQPASASASASPGAALDPADAGDAEQAGTPVVALGTARLAVAGITGAQLFVMLAVAAWVLQLLDDLPWASVSVEDTVSDAEVPRTILSIGLGVGALVVLWLGLAAVAAVITYHRFSVVRNGGDLLVRRGLLEVRETVVPLRRVQAVRIDQNLLRRPLGLVSVRIATAGDPSRESGHVVVPALRPHEVDALLDVVLPGTAPLTRLAPAPLAARRRAVTRRVAFVAVVGVPFVLWARTPLAAVVVATVVALAALVGLDAYRNLGLATPGRVVVTRVGSLVRTTWIVPDARTQSVRVRTSFFQRRADLATVHLDVAGQRDAPRVVDREDGRSRSLAAEVLATTVPA